MKAALAWKNSKKPMAGPAFLVLLFSAIIVIGVCIYKFTSKEIKPLVTLQALSHYLAFCILHVLVGYAEAKDFKERPKLMRAFYVFHVIYWIILAVSQTARCTKEDFYPDAFILNNCFSFGIFVMVYMLHSKEYLIVWGKDEQVAKKLFTAQTDRYISFYTFLIEWHIFELVVGKGLDAFADCIMCSEDGNKWIFATAKGNLFMMLHIIGTMMGTGMARAVFIKTAKAQGMLGGVEDGESDHEDDDAKPVVEAKKTK